MYQLFRILFAIVVLTGMAHSADAPKAAIDFSQVILDDKNQPVIDADKSTLTLATVSIRALGQMFDDERGLAGDEKLKRGFIAFKIAEAKAPLLLSPDEVTKIKQCVGKAWSPLVVARAWPMLDPTIEKP
jgi:hypothetical protein